MKLQALLEAAPKSGTWVKITAVDEFVEENDMGDGYWQKELKKDNKFFVMNMKADSGYIWIDKDGDEMEVPLKWVAPIKGPANTMKGHGRMGSSSLREADRKPRGEIG
jgi:predicted lipoprotein